MSKHKQAQHIAEDRHAYQDSVKYYRDIKNSLDTAREEGRQEEKLEVARVALDEGLPPNIIAKLTGLDEAGMAQLKEAVE